MNASRVLLAKNRDFRRLFLASVISLAGDWFSYVAVAELVTSVTGSAGAAAYIYAATVLPVFFASPIAGAAADRYDRRRMLVIADLARVPLALLLCVAAALHSVPIATIAIIALGVGASFSDPVASAATPNLVDAADLPTAQALMGAVWGSMVFVGAGLGALVAALFGRQTVFVVDAVSFLASAWLIAGIRRPLQLEAPAPRPPGQMREAIRYIRADGTIKRLILGKTGVSCANGTVGLLPAFAHARFAGTGMATGLMLAARGLGALLGPLLARAVAGSAPTRRAIVIVCGCSTLSYAAFYTLVPGAPWFPLVLLLLVLAHLGGGAQWSLSTYGLQVATPDHLRGRVMSLDYGLATLAIGLSAIAAGTIANRAGPATATYGLAAVAGVYGIGWLAWCAPLLRRPPPSTPERP